MRLSVVEKGLTGYKGEAWLVKDNETGNYYVVSRADTFDRGDETMIFPADEEGEVINWHDLYAGYGEDHETAMQNFEFVLSGELPYDPWENIRKNGNGPMDRLMIGLYDLTGGEDGD